MSDAIRIAIQATTLASLVWAAGGALYVVALGGWSNTAERAARRTVRTTVMLGLMGLAASVVLQLVEIGGDWGAAFDPFTLELFGESGGIASLLRGAGLLILALWLVAKGHGLLAMIGVLLITASFAFSGHVVSHEPTWILRGVLMVHVFAAAFWLGALVPLRASSLYDTPGAAAQLMDAFARRATLGLGLLAAGGGVLAVLLSDEWPWAWAESDWGRGLLLKLSLVTVLLGFAAWHRLFLTDRLRRNQSGAGRMLATSITLEIGVAIAVVISTAAFASRFSPSGE